MIKATELPEEEKDALVLLYCTMQTLTESARADEHKSLSGFYLGLVLAHRHPEYSISLRQIIQKVSPKATLEEIEEVAEAMPIMAPIGLYKL